MPRAPLLLCLALGCAAKHGHTHAAPPEVLDVPMLECPAVRAGETSGTVVLAVQVLETGHVGTIKIVEDIGHGCGEIAARALRDAGFRPATAADGRPVAAEIRYEYEFDRAD
jgi:protein TonB